MDGKNVPLQIYLFYGCRYFYNKMNMRVKLPFGAD